MIEYFKNTQRAIREIVTSFETLDQMILYADISK